MRAYSGGLAVILAACASNPAGSTEPPLGGSNTVTGTIVDLQTGQAIGVSAMLSVTGVPAAQVSVQGASFTIDGIPDNSSFQLLATAAPTYAPTFSPAIQVVAADVSGAIAYEASEPFLNQLATGFQVTPNVSDGVLLLHLVDSTGKPVSGVAGSNIVLAGTTGASGPHFLDQNLAASSSTSSSASGWAVFFNVPPGAIALAQAANATATLAMAESPVAAGTVTVANVQVTQGAPPPAPKNVSFANDVVPIFSNRGCTACHSGNKIGANLGNLALDGGANHIYGQLVTPTYPMRVVLSAPATSKVLTMPSYENPPDNHPNVTFQGPQDPDYQKILVWITEGAKNN